MASSLNILSPIFILSCIAVLKSGADLIVETPLGTVSGSLDTSLEIPVESFRGIPFAKPPVNERRFALPAPFGEFGALDATEYKAACVQSVIPPRTNNTSEDCLHLNVFRRENLGRASPVIVIIHGGAFAFGSAQDFSYNGVPLAAFSDAVVVTLQYRLGVLGFAMTDLIPANIGLFDQKLAIEWVHNYIEYFGGDKERVTLMGVSAGSMSVSAHIISPETREKNWFQSVIMDAGVIERVTANVEETKGRMKVLATKLGCAPEGEAMLTCLRDVDAQKLVKVSYDPEYSSLLTFIPVADGNYLPKDPTQNLLNANKFAKVRMLIGTAQDEGSLFVNNAMVDPIDLHLNTDEEFIDWCAKLSQNFKYKLNFNDPTVKKLLKEVYLTQYSDRVLAASRFLGDGSYYCPVNAFLKHYKKYQKNDIYVYQFHRLLAKSYHKFDIEKLGAFHWSPYIHFAGGLLPMGTMVDEEDRVYSIDSMRMISRFVNGYSPQIRGVLWPDFASTNKILILNERPEVFTGLRHQEECDKMFSYLEPDEDNRTAYLKNEL